MTFQRLILDFCDEEMVIRVLYRMAKPDGQGPGTKARTNEVSRLVKTGLTQALRSLEGGAELRCVGTSGFTTREDALSLDYQEGV